MTRVELAKKKAERWVEGVKRNPNFVGAALKEWPETEPIKTLLTALKAGRKATVGDYDHAIREVTHAIAKRKHARATAK